MKFIAFLLLAWGVIKILGVFGYFIIIPFALILFPFWAMVYLLLAGTAFLVWPPDSMLGDILRLAVLMPWVILFMSE